VVLQSRLGALGYRLGYQGLRPATCFYLEDQLDAPRWFSHPDPDITERLDMLETWQGPLPLSLKAWYEHIGVVNFTGMTPSLPFCIPVAHAAMMSAEERRNEAARSFVFDPALVVDNDIDHDAGANTLVALYSDPLWVAPFPSRSALYDLRDEWHRPLTRIALAPDCFFKNNQSGGGSYSMLLPDAGADGPLYGGGFDIPFVDYLRLSLRWAGFPGMRRWPRPPLEAIQELTDGLQPF
jgi:hypothetical protein